MFEGNKIDEDDIYFSTKRKSKQVEQSQVNTRLQWSRLDSL